MNCLRASSPLCLIVLATAACGTSSSAGETTATDNLNSGANDDAQVVSAKASGTINFAHPANNGFDARILI